MKLKGKLSSLTASMVAVVALGIPTVHAGTLSDDNQKLQQLKQQESSVASDIQSNQQKQDALKAAIQSYENSLQNIHSEIQANQTKINQLHQKEQQLNTQLNDTQQQLNTKETQLEQLVTAEYEDGKIPYLSVLFHASSFSDFLSRLYNMNLVSSAQNQLVQQVKQLKKTLQQKQQQVQQSEQQLQDTQSQLQTLQQTDEQIQAQKQHTLATIKQRIQSGQMQQNNIQNQISYTQSEIDAIKAQTKHDEEQAHNPTYVAQQTQTLVSANASSIISYAEQFLGTPYVWGGESPSGFDCSGLVQYVFEHAGISISRDTWDQFGGGVPVSRGDLQAGDLVFFSTDGPGASHVGIYIGGGMMIDAQTHGGVSLAPINNSYWGSYYLGARRYIK